MLEPRFALQGLNYVPKRNQGLNVSIQVGISAISARPKRFSVVRIVTASESLFSTIINYRNTNSGNNVGKSVLISHVVVIVVQEALVIVIIDESAQDREIRERSFVRSHYAF
jgi:hypothetical protein